MARIEVDIYVGVQQGEQPTLGHIRRWLSEVDKFNLSDDHPLYAVDIGLSFTIDSQKVEPILCGDCAPLENAYDVLLKTHKCHQ